MTTNISATRAPGGEEEQLRAGDTVRIMDTTYTVKESFDGEGGIRMLRLEEWPKA